MSEPTKPVVKQEDGYQDFSLRSCTKEEIEDARFHILKFQSKAEVDIMNNFTKPVRLHRKDPKNIQFQLTRSEIDQKKKEQQEQAELKANAEIAQQNEANDEMYNDKDEKSKRKEVDMSQVAPDGGARKPKKSLFKKKTRQINLMDDDKRKLRYEEYYPWVMEDYDGQNIWVGNYEAGNTDSYVLFVCDDDGFKMIPAEKLYKFTQRNKYATLTLEEAEAKMEKNSSVPRWLMKHMENSVDENSTPDYRFKKNSKRLKTVIGGSGSHMDRDSDHDDLDFDEEFADDEEAPIMDGDEEENKLSEQRMKKEMLKASNLVEKDENADDFDDLFDTRKVDKEGKKLRKVLNKTEGGMYDSDDEELNPYVSQDDLEDQEESESEVKKEIKDEDTIPKIPKKTSSPKRRSIEVVSIKDCIIVLKGTQQFLSGFPKGEWSPNAKKRTIEQSAKANKKIKLEKSTSPKPIPATEAQPVHHNVTSNLVTAEEVIRIVSESPLTTKELLHKLKGKVNSHPDNKSRIIELVKKHLRLENGKLAVKG